MRSRAGGMAGGRRRSCTTSACATDGNAVKLPHFGPRPPLPSATPVCTARTRELERPRVVSTVRATPGGSHEGYVSRPRCRRRWRLQRQHRCACATHQRRRTEAAPARSHVTDGPARHAAGAQARQAHRRADPHARHRRGACRTRRSTAATTRPSSIRTPSLSSGRARRRPRSRSIAPGSTWSSATTTSAASRPTRYAVGRPLLRRRRQDVHATAANCRRPAPTSSAGQKFPRSTATRGEVPRRLHLHLRIRS